MIFWIIIDGIIRFITFFLLTFCIISLFNLDQNKFTLNIITSLVISSVIFITDFFVFSTKLMDKKLKDSYCDKKNIKSEKLDNIDNTNDNTKNLSKKPFAYKTYQDVLREDNLLNEPSNDYKLQDSNTYDINYKSELINNDLENDEIEMEYVDANHLYVPPDYKSKIENLGYYYLMPEKWFSNPPVPPICLTQKKYKITPTIAYNVNLKKVNKPM